ncbi:MAG: VWA domain-containing protein [Firmicutes bacterium]|nr:VWA domain-containing protein [Bacillota bacterium]
MNNNLTELVFILDRSGSMGGLEKDTVGGYNSFVTKQQEESGEANLTTVLFDDKYDILHDRVDIKKVELLTDKEYFARGTTALLDAIGKTIVDIGKRLEAAKEKDRPKKVLFVITTDGHENASREYSAAKIKEMIQHQTDKYSWEFLFLGANIDAIGTARDLGIREENAVEFLCDSEGVELNYKVMAEQVASFRSSKKVKMERDWKREIQEDYKKRG